MLGQLRLRRPAAARPRKTYDDSYYVASQWQLMWRKFRRHKLALLGGGIIVFFYIVAIFAEFFAVVTDYSWRSGEPLAPPHQLHFRDEGGRFHIVPFVYGMKKELDRSTLKRVYTEDKEQAHPLRFFSRGEPYELFGFIPSDIHLFGVDEGAKLFLLGTDEFGRDLYSRIIFAARISLFIGLFGIVISFVLGCVIGGISGYFGGIVDMVIQRLIEFLISIPGIPLWIALAAALPARWSSTRNYFAISAILAIIGWTGLARVVRGKLLELREADFVMAARISNMSDMKIIVRHLLPSFASYLIVSLSLGVPGMIIAETSLSFLGIGIRPPAVSWGVLLQDAQKIRALAQSPWLLAPAIPVFIVVLCFNFLGDGLRDAADPYKS